MPEGSNRARSLSQYCQLAQYVVGLASLANTSACGLVPVGNTLADAELLPDAIEGVIVHEDGGRRAGATEDKILHYGFWITEFVSNGPEDSGHGRRGRFSHGLARMDTDREVFSFQFSVGKRQRRHWQED